MLSLGSPVKGRRSPLEPKKGTTPHCGCEWTTRTHTCMEDVIMRMVQYKEPRLEYLPRGDKLS